MFSRFISIALVLSATACVPGCSSEPDGEPDADTRTEPAPDAADVRGERDGGADAETGDAETGDAGAEFGFGPDVDERATPVFAPGDDGFFRAPWPSDARRASDGTIGTEDFPGRNLDIVNTYVDAMGELRGFSPMPVVYVPFDTKLPDSVLPSVAATRDPTSSLQLVALEEDRCGERVPVATEWNRAEGRYARKKTLQVAPAAGFPLQPDQTYGLVVLKDFGNEEGVGTRAPDRFYRALRGDEDAEASYRESLEPLRRCREALPFDFDQIGLATVFSTNDPRRLTRRLTEFVRNGGGVESPSVSELSKWHAIERATPFEVWRGTFEMPVFLQGEPPYDEEGHIEFDDDGEPEIGHREEVPFVVYAPSELVDSRRLFVHAGGTGIELSSHLAHPINKWMARHGFVVAAALPPFHGSRPDGGREPTLATFNFRNAHAARNVHRQQVAEEIYFRRLLVEELAEHPTLPDFQSERSIFRGHSQGAIAGSILAGIGTEYTSMILDGVGGYASTSAILETRDDVNTRFLLESAFRISAEADRFHLAVQMIQHVSDATDPLHYARYWRGTDEDPSGIHMLVSNGKNDRFTAKRAMRGLAVAGGLPPVGEPGWPYDPHGIVAFEAAQSPVRGNRRAVDGTALTFGTLMVADGDHSTIFRDETVRRAAQKFAKSSATPPPVIDY